MNLGLADAVRLASEVARDGADGPVDVAVCPPTIWLEAVAERLKGSGVRLGAQNVHPAESGAFTGEVSASMLAEVGARYVIVGHSERRQVFGESDAFVAEKASAALAAGLVPIVCVGETLDQRESGDAQATVLGQLAASLDGVEVADASQIVVAYEPVWAIGTGKTATPDQAQAMHAAIRTALADRFAGGDGVEILYGGSVKPGNAAELFAQPDLDGALVGGASLDAESFAAIAAAARAAS